MQKWVLGREKAGNPNPLPSHVGANFQQSDLDDLFRWNSLVAEDWKKGYGRVRSSSFKLKYRPLQFFYERSNDDLDAIQSISQVCIHHISAS